MAEQLLVDRIGHRADGIAETADGPVYVRYTLPGESVTVDTVPSHPERTQLLRVDQESPERVVPVCPHFGVCGGCALQHWAGEPYRAWKRALAATALAQAGLEAPVAELIDAHGEGRRRVTLHARRGSHDVLQVGYAAARAHRIVPIDRCPILAPGLGRAIEVAWPLAEALMPLRKPLDIQVTATDAGLDVDVRGSGPPSTRIAADLARIVGEKGLARLTRHGELVVQLASPTVRMGRAVVALPPGSFLQATAEGESRLAQLILGHLGDKVRTVADLFCGVGPFALRIAERARVSAFDSNPPAIEALRRAAGAAPGLKPVTTSVRDLFRGPLVPEELKGFEAVVFDPPRAGAEEQARQLAASKVPTVIAVSCNPGTFARDARILVDGGYRLLEVTPVDQFRYSAHVELVALFRRP